MPATNFASSDCDLLTASARGSSGAQERKLPPTLVLPTHHFFSGVRTASNGSTSETIRNTNPTPMISRIKAFILKTWTGRIHSVAIAMHLALMIASAVYVGLHKRPMFLKEDRAYLVPSFFQAGKEIRGHDFVQIISPWTGSNASNISGSPTLSETCGAALPVPLDFMRGDGFVANLWTYPASTGVTIDIGGCLCGFFALSLAFQFVEAVLGLIEVAPVDYKSAGKTRFNWLRFVEYSASGSLVVCTIAMVCGVSDLEVLVCIFFLCWGCMMAGLVGEICLRAGASLDKASEWRWWLLAGFWIAHATGFVSVTTAWWVVWRHFMQFYTVCDTPSLRIPPQYVKLVSDAAPGGQDYLNIVDQMKRVLGIWDDDDGGLGKRPPGWITGVMITEYLLFICFGGVQVWQGVYFLRKERLPSNQIVELCYVVLSLIAKGTLGILVFINLY